MAKVPRGFWASQWGYSRRRKAKENLVDAVFAIDEPVCQNCVFFNEDREGDLGTCHLNPRGPSYRVFPSDGDGPGKLAYELETLGNGTSIDGWCSHFRSVYRWHEIAWYQIKLEWLYGNTSIVIDCIRKRSLQPWRAWHG